MTNEAARQQMLTQQVRAWSVLDPEVLQVMGDIPRERFVPAAYRSLAFADTAIPLADGQQMLTPQLEGRILQALAITPADRVLEIGTGSGFLTACMARLATHVTSLEIRPALAEAARNALHAVGAANCEVLARDVFDWQPGQQFDCIVLTGSLPLDDARFREWLAPGGRLFMVIGKPPAMEALLVSRDAQGGFRRDSLFETSLPALDNAPRPEGFVF